MMNLLTICNILLFISISQCEGNAPYVIDLSCKARGSDAEVSWKIDSTRKNISIKYYVISWYNPNDLTSPKYEEDVVTDDDNFNTTIRNELVRGYDVMTNKSYGDLLSSEVSRERLTSNTSSYIIKKLSYVTPYNITLRVISRDEAHGANESFSSIENCFAQTGEGAPSVPLNLTAKSISKSKVEINWKIPRDINSKGLKKYIIQYGLHRGKKMTNRTVQGDVYRTVISDLSPYQVYQFRIVARNSKMEGQVSEWIILKLDVKLIQFSVILPPKYKKQFKQVISEIMPLAFLSSSEINSTKVRGSTNIKVYFNLSFSLDVNITNTKLQNIFRPQWVRNMTSYTTRTKAYDFFYCKWNREFCDKGATCTEMFGTHRCQCKKGLIDFGVKAHLFPGMDCRENTDPPSGMSLEVITPTSVKIAFKLPRKRAGRILKYQVEKRLLSGAQRSSEISDLTRTGFLIRETLEDLSRNSVYEFRARAVTSVTEGLWNSWERIATVTNIYKLVFDFILSQSITDYQSHKTDVEQRIRDFIRKKLQTLPKSAVKLIHYDVEQSYIRGNGRVVVEGVLYTLPPGSKTKTTIIISIKKTIKIVLQSRFDKSLGDIQVNSTKIEDVNECGTPRDDCAGSRCVNEFGTFRCKCAAGNVDVSKDYHFLPGRKCLVFDSPRSFSLSLRDPRTVELSWKIPPKMRLKEIRFWFIVQRRERNDQSSMRAIQVNVTNPNFTDINFAMTTVVKDLRMNAEYEFRLAAANHQSTGTFTSWKIVKTSTNIYTATLNLTKVVYYDYLKDDSHVITAETARNVRKLIDSILKNQLPQYTATGKVLFTLGLLGRTYAKVHLFLDAGSKVGPEQIQHLFKHSAVYDALLGLDMEAIEIEDFNECGTTWEDCSARAGCVNLQPGYECACNDKYIDRSENKKLPPGRICLSEDDLTTPKPTSQSTQVVVMTTTTKIPLPLPSVDISGVAIGPSKIRLIWRRISPPSGGRGENELEYVFQYKIKGMEVWNETVASPKPNNLIIGSLLGNLLYEIKVAERWKDENEAHTLFSLPLKVRTDPKAFRLYLHLPAVSPLAAPVQGQTTEMTQQVADVISNYVTTLYTSQKVLTKHAKVKFGSTGKVSLLRHPDRGVFASLIIYLTKQSTSNVKFLEDAYHAGEIESDPYWPVSFMTISDLDECVSSALNDCSPFAKCKNTNGRYECSCNDGYLESGKFYNLLQGRYCVEMPKITSTSRSPDIGSSSMTSSAMKSSSMTALSSTTKRILSPYSRSVSYVPTTQSTNPIRIKSSPSCFKGQRKVKSVCQDVLHFKCDVTVTQISGTNITIASFNNEGQESMKTIIKKALDHAFLLATKGKGFLESDAQVFTSIQSKFRVSALIVLESFSFRFKRQISGTVNSRALQEDLKSYLKKQIPLGVVRPKSSATVTFDPASVVISDIDECKSRRIMTDCDITGSRCYNTQGSFRCTCSAKKRDADPSRPGRICKDQCRPNPCFNEAVCQHRLEVGPPLCVCAEGYHGDRCQIKKPDEAEDQTLMVALLAVSGAIFIVLLCFFATCWAHRRNVRMKKGKPNEEESDEEEDSEFSDSEDDADDRVQPIQRTNHDETNEGTPPPTPRRTTSNKPRPGIRERTSRTRAA